MTSCFIVLAKAIVFLIRSISSLSSYMICTVNIIMVYEHFVNLNSAIFSCSNHLKTAAGWTRHLKLRNLPRPRAQDLSLDADWSLVSRF